MEGIHYMPNAPVTPSGRKRCWRSRRLGSISTKLFFASALVGLSSIVLTTLPATAAPGWSIVPTPNPVATPSQVTGTSCTDPNFCEAVGYEYQRPAPRSVVPTAESWDGTSWTAQVVPTLASNAQLRGVSCLTSAFCTAVGDFVGARFCASHSALERIGLDPTDRTHRRRRPRRHLLHQRPIVHGRRLAVRRDGRIELCRTFRRVHLVSRGRGRHRSGSPDKCRLLARRLGRRRLRNGWSDEQRDRARRRRQQRRRLVGP